MSNRQVVRASGTRRRHAEAREEIVVAAMALLSNRRFRELTVARLMAETSIGRSAFYFYFADLYQLASALLVRLRGEFLQAGALWLDAPEPSLDELGPALAEVAGVFERRGRVLRAIRDASSQSAPLEQAFRRTLARIDGAIEAAIRRGQRAGSIGALDARQTAIALNRLDLAYLDHWYGHARRRDRARLLATLERVWKNTLYADPPE